MPSPKKPGVPTDPARERRHRVANDGKDKVIQAKVRRIEAYKNARSCW